MKVKQDQLEIIQLQQKDLNVLLNNIGYLEAQKHGLLHQFAGVNKEVEDFKSDLESEYGAININMEDGTYTVIENVEEKVTSDV